MVHNILYFIIICITHVSLVILCSSRQFHVPHISYFLSIHSHIVPFPRAKCVIHIPSYSNPGHSHLSQSLIYVIQCCLCNSMSIQVKACLQCLPYCLISLHGITSLILLPNVTHITSCHLLIFHTVPYPRCLKTHNLLGI